MFSKKMFIFVGVAFIIIVNLNFITMSNRGFISVFGIDKLVLSFISPFQLAFTRTICFTEDIWKTYFMAVMAVKENERLRKKLGKAIIIQNQHEEIVKENARLRRIVDFANSVTYGYVAARVIARDPSPWLRTIIIDKGSNDGLLKGNPVIVPEGIVGQIINVSDNFSQVLLITDRNSAVDALVQISRARGIVKGGSKDYCSFVYSLSKDEIRIGQSIVTSGMDQVFPKGLKIGRIIDFKKVPSELFQDVTVETSVDFHKIEEVLVFTDTGYKIPE